MSIGKDDQNERSSDTQVDDKVVAIKWTCFVTQLDKARYLLSLMRYIIAKVTSQEF